MNNSQHLDSTLTDVLQDPLGQILDYAVPYLLDGAGIDDIHVAEAGNHLALIAEHGMTITAVLPVTDDITVYAVSGGVSAFAGSLDIDGDGFVWFGSTQPDAAQFKVARGVATILGVVELHVVLHEAVTRMEAA